jgi:hypothetical protein
VLRRARETYGVNAAAGDALASSLPDLIRQSMRRRNAFGESVWTTGSSPVVTKEC